LKKYTEISHEAADYYRQEAINLYITEQFCQGERFSMKKYEKLRNTAMQKDLCRRSNTRYIETEPAPVEAARILKTYIDEHPIK
jgi:hypothetical protein